MPPISEKSPRRRAGAKAATGKSAPEPADALSPDRVRDDFRWVYGELGGREALLAWSRENEKEFFRMFFQLLPRETVRDPAGEALVEALCELAEPEPRPEAPEKSR